MLSKKITPNRVDFYVLEGVIYECIICSMKKLDYDGCLQTLYDLNKIVKMKKQGYIIKEIETLIREWACPQCKIHHDRDKNASQNILNEGIKILRSLGIMITTVGTTGSHAWEDRVRRVNQIAVVDELRIHPL